MRSSGPMECFCGCGTKVPRKLTDAGILAGRVALELLAWDKARTTNPSTGAGGAETDALIAGGADLYQRLVSTLHGADGPDPVPETEAWLEASLEARRGRPDMTTKGSVLYRPKLTLTEVDYARLDRAHPELSFSAAAPDPVEPERADEDPVEQLRGLRELHAAGALTDEEFAAAKARVIGRLG